MKHLHVLNLGAGVQSTTLYLMFLHGELTPQLDCAIFADTGEEPNPVYRHLMWLKSLGGPPIIVRSAGRIGNDLVDGRNSTGQRFASIPAYTTDVPGQPKGMIRRQCTREYKLEVIERAIRRDLVGLKPREWFPTKDVFVNQYIGISADEMGRALRVRSRFAGMFWSKPIFPLIERLMTRNDCKQWLKKFGVPHEVPRSACVFCPYHSNDEWAWLRDNDPQGFARAVEVDEALRIPGSIVNRNLQQQLFVHRSCVPLKEAHIDKPENQQRGFYEECEGLCGV
jgi:hypothetical protein